VGAGDQRSKQEYLNLLVRYVHQCIPSMSLVVVLIRDVLGIHEKAQNAAKNGRGSVEIIPQRRARRL
jgi:hypothetical protein